MKRKAFTLVELIVVITILAILSTIAFISLQGYSSAARDSTRLSDVGSIKKVLELYALENGRYPDPSMDVSNVTFSGETVWTQGTFGDTVQRETGKISIVPLDPLTKTRYAYSVLNTKKEYEVGMALEGSLSKLEKIKTNAQGDKIMTSYITGNYNGKVAKIEKDNNSIILAVPTIINADLGETDYETIVNNQSLAYKNSNTLPGSYTGTVAKLTGTNQKIINKDNIVIFDGDLSSVNSKTFVENLQKAYSGTQANGDEIQEILAIDISNTEEIDNFTNNTLSRLGNIVENTGGGDNNIVIKNDIIVTEWDFANCNGCNISNNNKTVTPSGVGGNVFSIQESDGGKIQFTFSNGGANYANTIAFVDTSDNSTIFYWRNYNNNLIWKDKNDVSNTIQVNGTIVRLIYDSSNGEIFAYGGEDINNLTEYLNNGSGIISNGNVKVQFYENSSSTTTTTILD